MIDLKFKGSHPDAVAFRLQYAKVDGINPPVFTTVIPNPSTLPYTVADVPNGKYLCRITPIRADGSECPSSDFTTSTCAPLLGFSAIYDEGSDSFIISVTLPAGTTKVNIRIDYPGGGFSEGNYTPSSGTVTIARPVGITGVFTIRGRSVCDEAENYYGDYTQAIQLSTDGSLPCSQVTEPVASAVTDTTATITATPPVITAGIIGYGLRAACPVPGSGIVLTNTTPNFNLTGLFPGQTYQWGVYVLYDDGAGGFRFCPRVDGDDFTTTGGDFEDS